ncbi:ankyrin repeat domain-containing protein 37 isoform X2 [Calonectris borealis]|uniref:ankyrin repeat domain-containing protein 37 isoform X2 n=1 Tax=Calonectris borealis TaxID=1323832 RepID=UPI003F4B8AE9
MYRLDGSLGFHRRLNLSHLLRLLQPSGRAQAGSQQGFLYADVSFLGKKFSVNPLFFFFPRSRPAWMWSFRASVKSGSFSNLFEAGTGVNAPADAFGQSPAHLAACGGEAFFLLWQLQTGANLNQQDCLGEAPIHKAAKVGSLECLALLVAGDAKIDLCNNSGQTAADLALAYGFLECAKFLATIQHTQTMKPRGQPGYSLSDKHGLPREDPAAQKQESESSRSVSRKRRRSDDLVS